MFAFAVSNFAPQFGIAQVKSVLEEDEYDALFVPAPRELTRALTKARSFSSEGEYSEAIRVLAPIIEERSDEDFFVPAQGTRTFTSVLQEVTRVIGQMPRQGRDVYELQFGIRAAGLLEQAVEQNDIDKIRQISAKFYHTKAGYEATMLLGRYYLDKGEPLSAAYSFQRIVETPEAREVYKPQVQLLLATSWRFAGQEEKSNEVLQELSRQYPNEKIVIDGKQVELFANNSLAGEWLDNMIGSPPPQSTRAQRQWLLHRGNPQRTGQSFGGLPLVEPDWKVPISNDGKTTEAVVNLRQQILDESLPAIPSLNALAVANCIVTRSPDKLIGIDSETGKRIWLFPWEDQDPIGVENRSDLIVSERRMAESLPGRVEERLYHDAIYGQPSSDGRNLYFVDKIGYASGADRFGGGRFAAPMDVRDTNRLVALQVADESGKMVHSKLKWWVGDEDGMDEPALEGAFFLGSPLPLNDELFAICEVRQELRLVVLNSADGRLKWSQQLAAVELAGSITQDSIRRLAGATPSFSDGVLVCPTSTGAVIALDSLTRRLMWGFRYPRVNEEQSRRSSFQRNEQRRPGQKWADSTVTIVDGHVIVTPVDSNEILCLDLFDGTSNWKNEVLRESDVYIAGAWDRQIILAGDQRVRAIRLSDGSQAWETPLGVHGQISGRGYINGNELFLPTTRSSLLRIELDGGKIESVIDTPHPLGNLIVYQGKVISHGTDWVTALPQDSAARDYVARQFATGKPNSRALMLKSQLLMNDSKYTEAIDILLPVHRDRTLQDVNSLLVRAMIGGLRTDFDNAIDRTAEFENVIQDPMARNEYFRLKLAGLVRANEAVDAIETLFDLVNTPITEAQEFVFTDSSSSKVRWDRWVQSQIDTLTRNASDEQVARIRQTIARRVAAIVSDGTTSRLRRLADYLARTELAEQANIELARREFLEGNMLSAELLFNDLKDSQDQTISAVAHAGLARILDAANELKAAMDQYKYVAAEFPEVICWNTSTGSELHAEALADRRFASINGKSWRYGQVDVTEADETDRDLAQLGFSREFDLEAHRWPAPLALQVSGDSQNNVFIRDESGNTIGKISLTDRDRMSRSRFGYYSAPRYMLNGHLMIVSAGYSMIGIDLYRLAGQDNGQSQDPVLWRIDNAPPAQSGNIRSSVINMRSSSVLNRWGAPVVVDNDAAGNPIGLTGWADYQGLCFLRGNDLQCIDPLTGQTIWVRRNDAEIETGSDCFNDGEKVFVLSKDGATAREYSLFDGRQIDKFALPEGMIRWKKLGCKFFGWEEGDATSTMFVYDLVKRERIWEHELPNDSLANLVRDDRLVILQPDFRLQIIELTTGNRLIDTELSDVRQRLSGQLALHKSRLAGNKDFLEEDRFLQSILVAEDESHYFVGLNKLTLKPFQSIELANSGTRIRAAMAGPLFDGVLVKLDKTDGKSIWPSPAMIKHMAFPTFQPASAPGFVFVRELHAPQRGDQRTRPYVEMTIIDKRDGRPIFRNSKLATGLHSFRVTAFNDEQTMRVDLSRGSHLLRFTSGPIAPAVPAQEGIYSHRPKKTAEDMTE